MRKNPVRDTASHEKTVCEKKKRLRPEQKPRKQPLNRRKNYEKSLEINEREWFVSLVSRDKEKFSNRDHLVGEKTNNSEMTSEGSISAQSTKPTWNMLDDKKPLRDALRGRNDGSHSHLPKVYVSFHPERTPKIVRHFAQEIYENTRFEQTQS